MLCYGDREYSYEKINDFFSKAITGERTFNVDSLKNFLHLSWPNDPQSALQSAGSKDPNLILYILYRIECHRRRMGLEFKNLKLLHIKPQEIRHSFKPITWDPQLDSVGNITLCTSDPPADWHGFSFDEKKTALRTEMLHHLLVSQMRYLNISIGMKRRFRKEPQDCYVILMKYGRAANRTDRYRSTDYYLILVVSKLSWGVSCFL